MKIIFALFLSALIGFSAYAQPKVDPQTEVMMRMLKLKNSLTGKDSAGLADVLADDATYGHSNGLIQTKAELIRDIVSGVQNYNKIGPTDMVIRVYGNTAVVTLKAKVSMVMKGDPLELSMNVMVVWVKTNNIWQIVARQAVRNNQ